MAELNLDELERDAEIGYAASNAQTRALIARIRELTSDRDSWCNQAADRLKDWDDMRQRAEAAEKRIGELEQALQGCVDAMLHNGVPVDPEHPARVALSAAQAAIDAARKEKGHG